MSLCSFLFYNSCTSKVLWSAWGCLSSEKNIQESLCMLESGRRGSREPWWGRTGGTFRNKGDKILQGKWKCKKPWERFFSFSFSRDKLERSDLCLDFPAVLVVKILPDNPGGLVWFDPWVRRTPWWRKWQPTLYFSLENPMNKRAWQTTAHRVTNSQTCLSTHT